MTVLVTIAMMTGHNTDPNKTFWSVSVTEQLRLLNSELTGLSTEEAKNRLKQCRSDRLNNKHESSNLTLFLAQFKNSIILILLFATGLSFYLNDKIDAAIILSIILISGSLGFWQEKGAVSAIKELLALVQITVCVLRDNQPTEIPSEHIIPGDIILLKAGDVIPGDCLLIQSENLFIDEALLTGESYPVEKLPAVLNANTPLSGRTNTLWMGTHVQSGQATALIIRIGKATEFGK